MLRTVATVLIVAAISGWISRGEHLASVTANATDWVRTTDGWQSRQVVQPYRPATPPAVHPAVVAGFQLLASLLVLVAFPASARAMQPVRSKSIRRGHLRPVLRAHAKA